MSKEKKPEEVGAFELSEIIPLLIDPKLRHLKKVMALIILDPRTSDAEKVIIIKEMVQVSDHAEFSSTEVNSSGIVHAQDSDVDIVGCITPIF